MELTDYRGDIVWSAKYTAYGQLSEVRHGGGEQLEQPLRFQGQYHDAESGLHYNRHRYYQPDSGRYLTPDPVKLAGGLNAYRYVPNPTGWVDPLGLSGNCPGGDGCKKPVVGERDPESKVIFDKGEPDLPSIIHGVDPRTLNRTHTISGKGSTKKVETLANDMRTAGFDAEFPIDVAEHGDKLYILDGHHRASAARQTSTDVVIKLVKNIQDHKGSLNTIDDSYKFSG